SVPQLMSVLSLSLFFTTSRRPPSSTLFPYTTLFRSLELLVGRDHRCIGDVGLPGEHRRHRRSDAFVRDMGHADPGELRHQLAARSEEHTSELQSLTNLVCRLLLEKKKTKTPRPYQSIRLQAITSLLVRASQVQLLARTRYRSRSSPYTCAVARTLHQLTSRTHCTL